MTSKDIKDKINSVIDNIPDEVLEDVLEYLKTLTDKPKEKIRISRDLSKIIEEDKNLLERLAR